MHNKDNEQIVDINKKQISEYQTINDMQIQFDKMYKLSRDQIEVSWNTRLKRLKKLESLVNDNRDIISEVISQDFGKRSKAETLMAEIFPTLEEIRYAKKHGKDWMSIKKVSTGMWFLPASSYIQPQPLGLIGIIAPWNYPLFLSLPPLIGALVAGNRAMIKLSEHAPIYAKWLATAIPEYFSEDEICVVNGGSEVSQAFSSLAFDHLIFTGSTEVGKHVMRAASKNLTPVTLELGGKSPVIIDEDCDLEHTVSRVWTGKLLNAGQTCIAPDYVLLPEVLKTEFIEKSKEWINKHYIDIKNNDDYSHMINASQFNRIQSYLEDAKKSDATIHAMTDTKSDLESKFMPPYLVTDLPETSKLLKHEIFAPILPIVIYKNLNQAIKYVNDRHRPLALYVFSKNEAVCNRVMNETVSGGASINDTIYHIAQHELPFGGIGHSGLGSYHGKASFDTFSHYKSIFKQSSINAMGLMQPPYGKVFDKMMKVIIRE